MSPVCSDTCRYVYACQCTYADLSCLLPHAGGHEDASTGSGDSGVEGGSHHSESSEAPQNVFVPGEGVVTEADDRIVLRDVPIVTPNLDVVVPKLSLEVSKVASCIQRCTRTYVYTHRTVNIYLCVSCYHLRSPHCGFTPSYLHACT